MEENQDKVIITMKKELLESERQELRKKHRKRFLIVLLCVFLFLAGTGLGFLFDKALHPSYEVSASRTLGEIEFILDKYWLYSYDYDDFIEEIEDKSFYGMTSFNEDPYTTYMSTREQEEFSSSINMNYVGVGVQYETLDGIHTIKKVFKNSPAEIAGLQVGDIFLEVEGVDVSNLSTDEIKALVIGEAGTKVSFVVKRGNEEKEITCIREKVDSSIYAYTQDDYVVLELLSFGLDTAENCMKYLDEYTSYDKLIIDLRDNSGGYQTSVEEIAGLFIGNEEVYMIQQDKDGNEVIDYTDCKKTYDNFKNIVILVNQNTASAAEVLAICLKEQLDNVTLVGTTTYGKGVVQSQFSLSNGATIKVTTSKWLSPNYVWINGKGIKPDEEVKLHEIMYKLFYVMKEDSSYELDSVSSFTSTAQLSLDYLGYEVGRNDGYFDEATKQAIEQFQLDNNIEVTGILDVNTYNSIYYQVCVASTNYLNDTQKLRAIELLHQ